MISYATMHFKNSSLNPDPNFRTNLTIADNELNFRQMRLIFYSINFPTLLLAANVLLLSTAKDRFFSTEKFNVTSSQKYCRDSGENSTWSSWEQCFLTKQIWKQSAFETIFSSCSMLSHKITGLHRGLPSSGPSMLYDVTCVLSEIHRVFEPLMNLSVSHVK